MSRFIYFISILFFIGINATAQVLDPVKWHFSINENSEIILKAKMDPGWHLYGMVIPDDTPQPTTFSYEEVKGAELIKKTYSTSKLMKEFDEMFEKELSWYNESAVFIQKIKITNPDKFKISGGVKFMTCNDKSCLPPSTEEFTFTKKDLPTSLQTVSAETSEEIDVTAQKESESQAAEAKADSATTKDNTNTSDSLFLTTDQQSNADLWKSVINELNNYGTKGTSKNQDWWIILVTGFIGGLIALITPCVWPMIPMTVSFFLKRSKSDRKKAIRDAITYGLSIIIIYLLLGLLLTAVFGASALNELSTSATFNIIFCALLVLFAVSFLGAFELILPASWTNKLDSKADSTTGLISVFFMAFTLVLVSFSCTGPIIGTLLVEAASVGSITGPAIGMFGFAFALSIPFALFAIFPSWLQNLPKSGGWLNSVKVVLGFLELALALKFFSVADLAYGWRLLDREVFLVLWIIIFILLGLYLVGKIKFSHDSDLPYVSVFRLFMAIISFAFAAYMVPGLWGAPLKAISAFSPPLYTQDFNLYKGEVLPKYHDYESGMAYAKQVNKPIMIDFTGYGCVNCRKMEAAVWTDPRVKSTIDNDYVLISLYVDDKTPLSNVIEIEEFGKKRKLKTIGDKWSYLQRSKFGANAQPFYVLLDNNGKPIAPSYAYDKDASKYLDFLKKGLNEYKNADN